MKKIIIWFLLSCKRYVKKPSFLIILLLLPLGVLAVEAGQKEKRQEIRIAVSVQDKEDNELGLRLMERLVNRPAADEAGMFRFYECRNEDEVKAEVASRRAECGYVIYEGLGEKLDAGRYKRSIGIYSAPSTVAASLSSETVLAALMEMYDRELLMDYVAEDSLFDVLGPAGSRPREEAAVRAGGLYDKWLDNGSTFRFDYSFEGQNRAGEEAGTQAEARESVLPVRGLVAVYVYITALYGAVVLCGDEENGLFLPLSYEFRTPCRLASMAAPVVLAALSGILALWASGSFREPSKEIGVMIGYCAAVTAAAWLLKLICRKPQALCCVIPFFIIGSLLFCPVFIDAGRYLKAFDQAGRLFPPWYYLSMFR